MASTTGTINPKDDQSLMSEHTDTSSIEVTSNPPISDEESDRFRDCDCGEPLFEQHIVLDFTPTEEDTDYVQRKCCAFWEFINQQDDLDGLVAEPDLESTSESSAGDYVPIQEDLRANNQTVTPKLKSEEKTAVSMLELVEEKGLIDRVFESRLPTSHCSLGLNNYDDEESGRAEDEPPKPRLSIIPSYKAKSQMIRSQPDSQARVVTATNVRDMCKTLQEWDKKHPKSMEPPGPTPTLEHDAVELPAAVKHTKQCVCQNVCRVKKHMQ